MKPDGGVTGQQREVPGEAGALLGAQERRVPQAAQARIAGAQVQPPGEPLELLGTEGQGGNGRPLV